MKKYTCWLALLLLSIIFSGACTENTEQSDYLKVVKGEDKNAAYSYLTNWPKGKHQEAVKSHLLNLLFTEARNTSTIDGWQKFLSAAIKHGATESQINEAEFQLIELEFQKAKSAQSLIALQQFSRQYPAHKQKELQDAIWQLDYQKVVEDGTPEALAAFAQKWPQAPQSLEIPKMIENMAFKKASIINTVGEYRNLRKKYPEGEMAKKIDQAIHNIVQKDFKKACLIGTTESYLHFLEQYNYESDFLRPCLKALEDLNFRHPLFAKTRGIKLEFTRIAELENEVISDTPFTELLINQQFLLDLLTAADIEVNTNYPQQLTILLRLLPLFKEYETANGKTKVFTGATTAGQLTLESSGKKIDTFTFENTITPPATMAENFDYQQFLTLDKAPISKTLQQRESYLGKIIKLTGNYFGDHYLIALLHHPNEQVRLHAQIELEKRTKKSFSSIADWKVFHSSRNPIIKPLLSKMDSISVSFRTTTLTMLCKLNSCWFFPHFITYLDDPSPKLRNQACQHLQIITGEKYTAQESDKWRMWWKNFCKNYEKRRSVESFYWFNDAISQ